jgi:hypothetical protein
MPDLVNYGPADKRTPWNKGKLTSEIPGQSGHALPDKHWQFRAKGDVAPVTHNGGSPRLSVWPYRPRFIVPD